MNKFFTADVLEILKTLPNESVHCCVTSPPYWGLRDYGVGGQLGLEKTPEEYVNKLVSVFREVKRVLRDDGTLWLNLGDSYVPGGGDYKEGGQGANSKIGESLFKSIPSTGRIPRREQLEKQGLKPKNLVGIPWRVAFALQADGWYLRSDIIWEKPNAMPESVRDRPTKSHEYVFLLSKSSRYFYDADAIKEPSISKHPSGNGFKREARLSYQDKNGARGNDNHWSITPTRNKRTVWSVATKPFKGAHFAVFPPDLIRPCILAGTSIRNCPTCGDPWQRVINKTGRINKREACHTPNNCPTKTDSTGWGLTTIGTDEFIPSCKCLNNDGTGRSVVLDPFGGSGTVAMVASGLGRDSIYIDLNAEYTEMAKERNGIAFKEG